MTTERQLAVRRIVDEFEAEAENGPAVGQLPKAEELLLLSEVLSLNN